jgi:hypothetical protein
MVPVGGWVSQLFDLYHTTTNVMQSNQGYWGNFTSWEQLWLAFVMKEKSNKIWDGKQWIEGG